MQYLYRIFLFFLLPLQLKQLHTSAFSQPQKSHVKVYSWIWRTLKLTKDKHNTASLFTRCSTSKCCETVSVRSCGRPLWWSDATADRDARGPISSCGTADTATVALSNWPQDWRVPRNCATVCQSPTEGTGHLDLEVTNKWTLKSEGKLGMWSWKIFLCCFNTSCSPVPYQRLCSPTGGTPELEHGNTLRVMSRHLSQHNASDHCDVVGSQTRF